MDAPLDSNATHLVVTIHGIRTFGQWQERLEQELTAQLGSDEVEFINYKFGYFSVIAFLIPVLRWLVVARFKRQLRRLHEAKRWTRIDIVAHSFGTHVASWAVYGLRKDPTFRIHTMILAGSVLRAGFPWDALIGSSVYRVINECGTQDSILILSQFLVLFTGMAGRTGFAGATSRSFRNRYFKLGHSGYFFDADGAASPAFMIDHWLPLLHGNRDIELFDCRLPTEREGLITVLSNNAEPIKIALYVSPFAFLTWFVWGLYTEADLQRRQAEQALLRASTSSDALVKDIANRFSKQSGVPDELVTGVLRNAKDLVDGLAAVGHESIPVERSLATSLAELSQRYLSQNKLSDALDAADRSLKIFTNLYKTTPTDDNGTKLFAAYDRKGDVAMRLGDLRTARAVFDQQHELAVELLGKAGQSPAVRRQYAISLEKLAYAYAPEEPEKSLAWHRESLKIRKDIAASEPASPELQSEIATSDLNIADALRARGSSDEALGYYLDAIVSLASISASAPRNTEYMRDLSVAHQKIGDYYAGLNSHDKALSDYRRNLELLRTLYQGDKSNILWQMDLFKSYIRVGGTEEALGNAAAAAQAFGDGAILARSVAETHPAQADWRAIAGLVQRLCRSLVLLGRRQDAMQQAESVMSIFEKETQSNPAERERYARVANNHSWYAILNGSYTDALASIDKAIAIDPDSLEFRLNKIHALALTSTDAAATEYFAETAQRFGHEKIVASIEDDIRQFRTLGLASGDIAKIEGLLK